MVTKHTHVENGSVVMTRRRGSSKASIVVNNQKAASAARARGARNLTGFTKPTKLKRIRGNKNKR